MTFVEASPSSSIAWATPEKLKGCVANYRDAEKLATNTSWIQPGARTGDEMTWPVMSQSGSRRYEVRLNVHAFADRLEVPVRALVQCTCSGYNQCARGRVCKHAGAILILGSWRPALFKAGRNVTFEHLIKGRRDVPRLEAPKGEAPETQVERAARSRAVRDPFRVLPPARPSQGKRSTAMSPERRTPSVCFQQARGPSSR